MCMYLLYQKGTSIFYLFWNVLHTPLDRQFICIITVHHYMNIDLKESYTVYCWWSQDNMGRFVGMVTSMNILHYNKIGCLHKEIILCLHKLIIVHIFVLFTNWLVIYLCNQNVSSIRIRSWKLAVLLWYGRHKTGRGDDILKSMSMWKHF